MSTAKTITITVVMTIVDETNADAIAAELNKACTAAANAPLSIAGSAYTIAGVVS